jgi:hypothetical protein
MINWASLTYLDNLGILRWRRNGWEVTFMQDDGSLTISYKGHLYDAQAVVNEVEKTYIKEVLDTE